MTLGSLCDGSGTIPLAATMHGIEPVWASEIEPYPISVTRQRFPNMKHLGDISKIHGDQIQPVDIIAGGSPCQDLSVAGKQQGLHDGERSRLFFEMTRIIREMMEATHGKYPKYVVWENVPGAFSSNRGADFLAVLQAFAEIADPYVHVPKPEAGGGRSIKWKYAGSIVGDTYSIAWRTMDAQYWGVPQRRRRIYLVASYSGVPDSYSRNESVRHSPIGRAGNILFEPEGLSWYSSQGFDARERTTENFGGCTGSAGALSMNTQVNNMIARACGFDPQRKAESIGFEEGTSATLVNGTNPGYHNGVIDNNYIARRLTPTECARLQGFPDGYADTTPIEDLTDEDAQFWEEVRKTYSTVMGKTYKPCKDKQSLLKWVNGLHTDSSEYKMWGNGMCLNNAEFVIGRIAEFERNRQKSM